MTLAGRHILLIIGGGIAACSALELIRQLRRAGAGVVPVMTQAAAPFVTPLSVATLAGHRVYSDLSGLKDMATTGHNLPSQLADLIVVAPATADLLAGLAGGQADDLASVLVPAAGTPVLVAPAMEMRMWDHAATRRTMARVLARGVACICPDSGGVHSAGPDSGEYGPDRMAGPEAIMQAIGGILGAGAGTGVAADGRGADWGGADWGGADGGGADGGGAEGNGTDGGGADGTGVRPQASVAGQGERAQREGARGNARAPAAVTRAAPQTPPTISTDAAWEAEATGPAATDPAATGPADTDPAATGPDATNRAAAGPAVTDPAAAVPPGLLSGRHVLITSGPTHEPIDPVRYIANRSSGAQGAALAVACRDLGARVTFVTGPASVPPPPGVHVVRVETALEMLAGVQAALPADVAIFAAAVADWRVANAGAQKLKKTEGGLPVLEFAENPDILATIAAHAQRPGLVVGFAAETHDVAAYAHAKRLRKGCDWIVANDVSPATGIMGGSDNAVHLITAQGAEVWPMLPKPEVARRLAARIAAALPRDAGGSGGGRDRAALADAPAPPDPAPPDPAPPDRAPPDRAPHDPAPHAPTPHAPDVS